MAAAIWGILAFGDGMASLVGSALSGPRLPWNPRKGVIGSLAFVAFGTLGAAVLMAWTSRLPLDPRAWHAPRTLGVAFALALVTALVESCPRPSTTTSRCPWWVPSLAPAGPGRRAPAPARSRLQRARPPGPGAECRDRLLAWAAGSIDALGAVSAVVIGTVITGALGLPFFAMMVAFFVIGSIVTRIGYRKKAALGIAQERGGARGMRNAWANGGVPAFLALMAGLAPPLLRDLLVLAYAASVATAAADTCSSEIGKAYGRRTFLITTFRPVPPGTEGAVSLEGTLGGLLGAASWPRRAWPWAPSAGAAAALVARGRPSRQPGRERHRHRGRERRGWIGNDLLNATNTAIGGDHRGPR